MNERDEIDQLLRDYLDGIATQGETHDRILSLVAKYDPDRVVTSLPEPWRASFVEWAADTFGNAMPPEDFIVIHQSPLPPADTYAAIVAIRDWLSRRTPTG